MRVVNTELLSNPYNWAIIFIMVLFGLILVSVIFHPEVEEE